MHQYRAGLIWSHLAFQQCQTLMLPSPPLSSPPLPSPSFPPGHVDMVVCGAGTGGTVAGIGRKFKEKVPKCEVSEG